MRRASSSSVDRLEPDDEMSPRLAATTSPHSTSTMPANAASSPSARSSTSAVRSSRYRSAWCNVILPHCVAVHERERRRRDRLGHTQGTTEALRERGLAGPHVAGQHDHVAGRARPASTAATAWVVAGRRARSNMISPRCYGAANARCACSRHTRSRSRSCRAGRPTPRRVIAFSPCSPINTTSSPTAIGSSPTSTIS